MGAGGAGWGVGGRGRTRGGWWWWLVGGASGAAGSCRYRGGSTVGGGMVGGVRVGDPGYGGLFVWYRLEGDGRAGCS